MAAANESQGLKIAVAAFITLSVLLSVTSYFLYSAYSSADARLTTTAEDLNKAKAAQGLIQNQYEDMRTKIGTRADQYESAKEEITNHFKKIDQRLNDLTNQVNAAVQKVQQTGVQRQELEDTKNKILQAIQSYRNEPNKTYSSSLGPSTELMENVPRLSP